MSWKPADLMAAAVYLKNRHWRDLPEHALAEPVNTHGIAKVCLTAPATTEGSGYQVTRFSSAKAARLASQDATAGPAIHSNNQQCMKDPACRK